MSVNEQQSSASMKLKDVHITMDLYDAGNKKIEKTSKLMQNIFVKIMVTFYGLFNVIVSYFNFYVMNLSEESFHLVFHAS